MAKVILLKCNAMLDIPDVNTIMRIHCTLYQMNQACERGTLLSINNFLTV